jgi:hypothetical protein
VRSRLLLPISLLLLAAGCASTGMQDVAQDRADTQYMAAVERAARAVNVQVVWINPPQRRAATQTPATR